MSQIDIQRFSQLIRQKRGSKNLRDTAKEIGDVSLSTLSRVEQGKLPDLSTFLKICAWLEMSPNDFAPEFQNSHEDHREKILYHLRADNALSPEVADALQKFIELAYANAGLLINRKNEEGI